MLSSGGESRKGKYGRIQSQSSRAGARTYHPVAVFVQVEEAHMLQQPGTKKGQNKFIKEPSGAVSAYTWDAKGWQVGGGGGPLCGVEAACQFCV